MLWFSCRRRISFLSMGDSNVVRTIPKVKTRTVGHQRTQSLCLLLFALVCKDLSDVNIMFKKKNDDFFKRISCTRF